MIKAILDHGERWRRGDAPLTVFPESTTTNGKTVIPFKKGVFLPGKPVRPVLLYYANGLVGGSGRK